LNHQFDQRGCDVVLRGTRRRRGGLAPIDAMVHAMLTFGDLPDNQREAWRVMFEHFVFGPPPEHLPEDKRGLRGKLSEASKERLRRQLGQMMAR
jgi:hypothetical protein